jgi:hypothetical protein
MIKKVLLILLFLFSITTPVSANIRDSIVGKNNVSIWYGDKMCPNIDKEGKDFVNELNKKTSLENEEIDITINLARAYTKCYDDYLKKDDNDGMAYVQVQETYLALMIFNIYIQVQDFEDAYTIGDYINSSITEIHGMTNKYNNDLQIITIIINIKIMIIIKNIYI